MAISLDGTTGISAPTGTGATFTASVSGDVTLNFSIYQNFVLTLTGNVTLLNPTTETIGQGGTITIIQDGAGNRTVSVSSDFETRSSAGVLVSPMANATDVIPYKVIAADRILLGGTQRNFG